MELESKMFTKKLDLQEREDRHPKRSIEKQGGQLYLEFIKWPSVKYTALNSQSDTRSGQNCPDNCIRQVLQVLRIQRLSSAELSAQPTSQPNCAGIAALTAVANGGGALRNAFRQGVQPPSDYTMRFSVIFKILKNYGRLCSERSENFLI